MEIILTILGLLIGSGVTAFIAIKKLPKENNAIEANTKAIEANTKSTEVAIVAKVREIYDDMIADLQEQLNNQRTRVDELSSRLEESRQHITELSHQLDEARDRIKALEDENKSLKVENDRLRAGGL